MFLRVASHRSFSLSRSMLQASVSALALLAAASPAVTKPLVGGGSGIAATTAASNAAMTGAREAAAAAQQAQGSLTRATQAIAAMQAAQAAARAAAQGINHAAGASQSVPNGLGVGGLDPLSQ